MKQHAFASAISPHRAFNSSQQQGLSVQSLASETGQPLQCLVYHSTCRSYLVYQPAGSVYSVPSCWPIKSLQTTCSNLDYDITPSEKSDFKHVAVSLEHTHVLTSRSGQFWRHSSIFKSTSGKDGGTDMAE